VFISGDPDLAPPGEVAATDVKELLLGQLFNGTVASTASREGVRAR
jgi:hypothetical protein